MLYHKTIYLSDRHAHPETNHIPGLYSRLLDVNTSSIPYISQSVQLRGDEGKICVEMYVLRYAFL